VEVDLYWSWRSFYLLHCPRNTRNKPIDNSDSTESPIGAMPGFVIFRVFVFSVDSCFSDCVVARGSCPDQYFFETTPLAFSIQPTPLRNSCLLVRLDRGEQLSGLTCSFDARLEW